MTDKICWPEEYRPEKCVVFAHNDITIPARPDVVWSWLVAAPTWPQWYHNSHWVRLPEGDARLAPGMTFGWMTFGLPITSLVTEFDTGRQLGWTWWRSGAKGYHAWLLREVAGGQTQVITEETQFGILPTLSRPLMRRMLHYEHGKWLQDLAGQAVKGGPT